MTEANVGSIHSMEAAEGIVTLFVSLQQRVEQHLECGGVIETRQDLYSCGVRKETFPSVYSLTGKEQRNKSAPEQQPTYAAY